MQKTNKQTKTLKYPRCPKNDSQIIKNKKLVNYCTDALFCDLRSHKAALHKMCTARTCDVEAASVVSLERTEQQQSAEECLNVRRKGNCHKRLPLPLPHANRKQSNQIEWRRGGVSTSTVSSGRSEF